MLSARLAFLCGTDSIGVASLIQALNIGIFQRRISMSDENNLSRRKFIRSAAAEVAAVAGAGALAGLGTSSATEKTECASRIPAKWDYAADLVIVGSGMAGLSTAITAADAGAKVLILEKLSQKYEGGNSKVCMQFIWAPKDIEKGIVYIRAMDCGMTGDEEIYRIMSEGLAENLKVLKDLGATLAPYCADKKDSEFGRNPGSLMPLSGPPFYAMKQWPNTANTMGGPRRNKLCQIVDPDKKPIARLYGTGELGSFWGWGYNSGGNIGECLFSGRIAANHAVALKPWDAGA